MTYLISNSETADDIMRYIKSGAVEVPEWALKLIEHIEDLNVTIKRLEAELWLED